MIEMVDMEMHGVYQACDLSSDKPLFLGAKTVVDLADSGKGDKHHEAVSIISAHFIAEPIVHILSI